MLKGDLISSTLRSKSLGLSPSLNIMERRLEEGEGRAARLNSTALSMHGTGLRQAVRLVINLRDSWGQAGREKLSKHGFGTSIDKISSGDESVSHQAGSLQSFLREVRRLRSYVSSWRSVIAHEA